MDLPDGMGLVKAKPIFSARRPQSSRRVFAACISMQVFMNNYTLCDLYNYYPETLCILPIDKMLRMWYLIATGDKG